MSLEIEILDKILEKNLKISLHKIMVKGYSSATAGFVKGVLSEDLLGRLTINAINFGFERKVKNCLLKMLKFYKNMYNPSAQITKLKKEHDKLKEEIEKMDVLSDGYLFKDALVSQVDLAVCKVEKLKDPSAEMYLEELVGLLDRCNDALQALKVQLNRVIDWSSEKALDRAKKVFEYIKEWGNLRMVYCFTSTNGKADEVVAPLNKAVEECALWANVEEGVSVDNPRCVNQHVNAFAWNDDQLKVWCGLD
ncbi:MAG: hypothetical protein E7353_05790 [Clostridiales bacterium]|nr:hypothetical protein [Clostridiales bacterium]